MSALTRIIADRSDGALFFGDYYMMDYELMGGDARVAIAAESTKLGLKAPRCRQWCHSARASGRCGARRGGDLLRSPTCRKRSGRFFFFYQRLAPDFGTLSSGTLARERLAPRSLIGRADGDKGDPQTEDRGGGWTRPREALSARKLRGPASA